MPVSRRNFIKIGGLTALAALAAPEQLFGKARNISGMSSADFGEGVFQLSSDEFSKQIGSHFWLMTESGATEAVLTEVRSSERRKRSKKNNGECFSLVFSLSENEAKAQATYTVMHRTLGNFPLFLVPGESAGGEQLLIAVINRL